MRLAARAALVRTERHDMDVRDLREHEADDCGYEIARMFEKDEIKASAIMSAWWDQDEDEQELIHDFLCGHKRSPEAMEAAHNFEAAANAREEKTRKRQQQQRERDEKRTAERRAKLVETAQKLAWEEANEPVPAPPLRLGPTDIKWGETNIVF